jgi:periplasmic protein TonB
MTEPNHHHDQSAETDEKRPYRPPVGMPLRGEGRWGAPFSLAVHVVLILLLVTPLFARVVAPELFPGGGPGPAGGGGGGRGGAGGWRPEPITPEGLRYMRVAPEPPPPATPDPAPEEVQVPQETPPPQPQPAPPAEEPALEQAAPAVAPLPGTGGGTGNDGTNGTGPGTGGGVGSGVGTGTGSATGPGTGGGAGRDYLPTPDFLPLPPEPRPGRVRGRSIAVTFTVNERGEIVSLDFASTGDRGYDRRFRERLREARFRPAVGPDGQPMAATFPITFQL